MYSNKYTILDNMHLILMTALVAFFLHKYIRGKKADAENTHVLGTARGSHMINSDADTSKQSETEVPEGENPIRKIDRPDNKPKNASAKDAAANRNYEKLLANKARPTECEKLTEVKIHLPTVEGSGYLNFDKFMSGSIALHSTSEVKKNSAGQSTHQTNQQASLLTPDNSASPTIQLHTTAQHPGLEAYYRWKSTIMSLYRVYAIPLHSFPQSTNGNNRIQEAVLPMHPSSERGNTSVYIEVTNLTSYDVAVYWIDYRGNEVYKGSMRRGQTWTQTTWIGHPWTFRKETSSGLNDGCDESILLKYVPFRVIPSIQDADTVYEKHGGNLTTGMQRFTLKNTPNDYGVVIDGQKWRPACVVDDYIMPEPPLVPLRSGVGGSSRESQVKLMEEIYTEIEWSCQQIQREEVISQGCGLSAVKRLRQYLSNVSVHPQEPKYRKLRICNPLFSKSIYDTGARGVLLALGFEEYNGYLECGAAEGQMLTEDRRKMFSDTMAFLFLVLDKMKSQNTSGVQPNGADGFGRAGFGYAGSINQ